MMFLTLWIQKTESCLRHPPHKPRVEGKGIQTERGEKLRDEINKRQELYEEERSQLLQEPEYFTQDDSNSADYEVIDPLSDADVIHDEDYPEFPPIAQENLTYPDYKNPDMEEDELDVYDDKFENIYDEYLNDYLYEEYLPVETKNKRDTAEVLSDLAESGAKLISGNLVGGVTSFVKSLAKPIFSYFIHSNNDHAMQKFTNRLLPETGFKDSAGAHIIRQSAHEGDGEKVWHQLSNQPRYWNPRSNFIRDKYHKSETHIECRRNVPIIDRNLVHRLKSVSLMMTSLMTSLHDTTIADLNQGFKKASEHFQDIRKTTKKILNATVNNLELDLILDLLKDTAVIVELIQEDIVDKSDEMVEFGLIGVVIVSIFLFGGVLVSHIRKNDHKTEEIQNELKELKKLLSPAEVKETEDDRTRRAVVSAVKETMDAMAGQMLGHQNHMDQQTPAVLRVGNYAVRQPSGTAALPRTNYGGAALTYQQYL